MDNISHAVWGGSLVYSLLGKKLNKTAIGIGVISANAADLDVLIRSSHDPLVGIEFHRHFTHSFAFAPLGAAICMLPFLIAKENRTRWKLLYVASLVAYFTHPILDLMTSYGTQIFWPFTSGRYSWDWIAIVDPLFTLPLFLTLSWSAYQHSRKIAWIGFVYSLVYLCFGGLQHFRATSIQENLALIRRHTVTASRVMPTLGNLLVWRSVYKADGYFYADAIRVPLFAQTSFKAGEKVAALETGFHVAVADPVMQEKIERDIKRFMWFSDSFAAQVSENPIQIGDVRYGFDTEGLTPLWSLQIQPEQPDRPITFVFSGRDRKAALSRLVEDLKGIGFEPIE